MNTSGEAADQVMRMMLNGAEVLVKLSGGGAKNAAVLLLYFLKKAWMGSNTLRAFLSVFANAAIMFSPLNGEIIRPIRR